MLCDCIIAGTRTYMHKYLTATKLIINSAGKFFVKNDMFDDLLSDRLPKIYAIITCPNDYILSLVNWKLNEW